MPAGAGPQQDGQQFRISERLHAFARQPFPRELAPVGEPVQVQPRFPHAEAVGAGLHERARFLSGKTRRRQFVQKRLCRCLRFFLPEDSDERRRGIFTG